MAENPRRDDEFERMKLFSSDFSLLTQLVDQLNRHKQERTRKEYELKRCLKTMEMVKQKMNHLSEMNEKAAEMARLHEESKSEYEKELEWRSTKLKESQMLVLKVREREHQCKKELEEANVQNEELSQELEKSTEENLALSDQLATLKSEFEALKEWQRKKRSEPSSTANSRSRTTSTSKSERSFVSLPSCTSTKLPIAVVTKKSKKSALHGCIRYTVPNFSEWAERREFIKCSPYIVIAGFRWALRVKGAKPTQGNIGPAMLSLWLWAKGSDDCTNNKQWEITATMVFRVKSANERKTADIVKHSGQALFSNKTTAPRSVYGLKMEELENLTDVDNCFIGRKDNLNVEVEFSINQTKYTI